MLFERERAGIDTNRVVKREGDDTPIFGTIMEYGGPEDANLHDESETPDWTVQYDNGDVEMLTFAEIREASEAYKAVESEDPTPVNLDHLNLHQSYMPNQPLA